MKSWSTDLLSPVTEEHAHEDEQKESENNRAQENPAIIVPFRGWYGICFGKVTARPDTRTKKCSNRCSFAVKIQTPDNEERSSTSLNLPFVDVMSIAIICVDIGKLLFFEKDTAVSVVRTTQPSNGVEEPCCCASFRWRLVLQHPIQLDTADAPKTPQKPLMCVLCKRRYESVQSIQLHRKDTHGESDDLQGSNPSAIESLLKTPLQVIYQDDALAVVNKPQGIPVMGDKQTLARSDLFLAFASPCGLRKPIAVHRLDAATGGLLVVAKTKKAEVFLKECFAKKSCRKRYRALVFGKLQPREGIIDQPVSGKEATTKYRVVQCIESASLLGNATIVDLFPVTGRKHQLRKHMKFLGHPIWGDMRYGPPMQKNNRQEFDFQDRKGNVSKEELVQKDPYAYMCLWAMEISFPHPDTRKETVATLEEPQWLQTLSRHISGHVP